MGLFSKFKTNDSGSIEWLIVGLGNPGTKYLRTRHNCGWLTIDNLSAKYKTPVTRSKFKSLCATVEISGKKCLVMKPTTMMNNSGEAVVEAMNFYKVPLEKVLVISDDTSLDVGKIRIKRKGSDGGQRGLRSIITLTGSENFPRVKIGVGAKPHPDYDLGAWVLSEFSEKERPVVFESFVKAVEAIELIVGGKTDEAMNRFN